MAQLNIEKVIPALDWSADIIRKLLFGQVLKGYELNATSILVFFALFHLMNILWKRSISLIYPTATEKMKREGGIQIVSILASLFICLRGLLLFYAMLDRSPSFQYLSASTSSRGTVLSSDPAIAELESKIHVHTGHTNEVLISYLAFDTVLQLMDFGRYGKMDMLIHHVVFLVVSITCHHYMVFLFMFTILSQGEWSTIFLDLRWLCRESGKNSDIYSMLFAVSFFVVRIILIGYGLAHMLLEYPALEAESTIPTPYFRLFTAALVAIWFLNLYWFRLIVRMARRTSKKKESNSTDASKKD